MELPVCQADEEAYNLYGIPRTQAERDLEDMATEANYMSAGMTAWRAIAFAIEAGAPMPSWVIGYLRQSAEGIEDWSGQNGHPAQLKKILMLEGKRQYADPLNDPRWVYATVSQLSEQQPKASITALVRDCMRQFPRANAVEEHVRQQYYAGKRLAEKGEDYKGRARSLDMGLGPSVAARPDRAKLSLTSEHTVRTSANSWLHLW